MGGHGISEGKQIPVERTIQHVSYNPNTMSHDIALLKLQSAAPVEEKRVGLVCLIRASSLQQVKICWITGWGTTNEGGSSAPKLREAKVPLVKTVDCKTSYGKNGIDHTMLCAGYETGGVDACQGDSGGPMVFNKGDTWYLAGATSWGIGCARPEFYGVYANVPYFYDWVRGELEKSGHTLPKPGKVVV